MLLLIIENMSGVIDSNCIFLIVASIFELKACEWLITKLIIENKSEVIDSNCMFLNVASVFGLKVCE